MKRSSAQIKNYEREELEGRLVIGVVNFPPRQIGPVRSEVLVLGTYSADGRAAAGARAAARRWATGSARSARRRRGRRRAGRRVRRAAAGCVGRSAARLSVRAAAAARSSSWAARRWSSSSWRRRGRAVVVVGRRQRRGVGLLLGRRRRRGRGRRGRRRGRRGRRASSATGSGFLASAALAGLWRAARLRGGDRLRDARDDARRGSDDRARRLHRGDRRALDRRFWAWSTSTAPALTIATAARPAAAFVATALTPAVSAPPAPAAPAAAPPAPAVAPAALLAPAVVPTCASRNFFSMISGPTGKIAASALLVCLRWSRNAAQRSQDRDVAARRRADPVQALGCLAELLAHLLAGHRARLGGLGERNAGAHEQRLDRRDRGLHRLGDLLVAQRVDLAQQQCGALRLGQRLDVLEQLADRLAPLHVLDRRLAVVGEVHVHRVDADRLLAAQVVQRAVARDPVQPRAHVDRAVVGQQRVERRGEDLLQHVLGVLLGGEHVAAEREQPRLVAGDERLVGGLVALAGQRDQPLVALQAQQWRRTSDPEVRMFECGGFHGPVRFNPRVAPELLRSCPPWPSIARG